jgi:hypothetical protein
VATRAFLVPNDSVGQSESPHSDRSALVTVSDSPRVRIVTVSSYLKNLGNLFSVHLEAVAVASKKHIKSIGAVVLITYYGCRRNKC